MWIADGPFLAVITREMDGDGRSSTIAILPNIGGQARILASASLRPWFEEICVVAELEGDNRSESMSDLARHPPSEPRRARFSRDCVDSRFRGRPRSVPQHFAICVRPRPSIEPLRADRRPESRACWMELGRTREFWRTGPGSFRIGPWAGFVRLLEFVDGSRYSLRKKNPYELVSYELVSFGAERIGIWGLGDITFLERSSAAPTWRPIELLLLLPRSSNALWQLLFV